jgi:hypothetical protein
MKAASGARCFEVSQQGYLLFPRWLRECAMLSGGQRRDDTIVAA